MITALTLLTIATTSYSQGTMRLETRAKVVQCPYDDIQGTCINLDKTIYVIPGHYRVGQDIKVTVTFENLDHLNLGNDFDHREKFDDVWQIMDISVKQLNMMPILSLLL